MLSLFVPGFSQLLQGRLSVAVLHILLCAMLWCVGMGWIMHCWSCLDAVGFKARERRVDGQRLQQLEGAYVRSSAHYARKYSNGYR